MKYNKSEPITDLLHQYLRAEGLETPLNEYRVVSTWPDVVEEVVAKATGKIFIKNQILNVQIKSPVIRQELMMRRHDLVQKLNAIVGAAVIIDIRLF